MIGSCTALLLAATIDEDFRPATHFDFWLYKRWQPYIEELEAKHAGCVTSVTGSPPTRDDGPKILWWMHEAARRLPPVAKFLMPVCNVAGRIAPEATEPNPALRKTYEEAFQRYLRWQSKLEDGFQRHG